MIRTRASKAHIQQSINAVKACNLPISAVTVLRDGSVKIDTIDLPPPAPEGPDLQDRPIPWT